MRAIAHVSHVENAREQNIGRVECRHADDDWAQPSYLLLAGHRATVPWNRRIALTAVVYQREALPLRIFEHEHQPAIVLKNLAVAHALFIKTT